MLDFEKNVPNNDNSAHSIIVNIKLKETKEKNEELTREIIRLKDQIIKLKCKENKVLESYQIKKMTAESLEKCIKTLEEYCTKVMNKET